MTSKHNDNYYCINCHSEQETNLNHMKMCAKVTIMKIPKKYNLKYNQDKKSVKIRLVIFANAESLIENIQTRDNNPEKLFK